MRAAAVIGSRRVEADRHDVPCVRGQASDASPGLASRLARTVVIATVVLAGCKAELAEPADAPPLEPRNATAASEVHSPAPAPSEPAVFDETTIAPRDQPRPARTPDVVYVPTPQPVVDAMLEIAAVGPGDVLYDLGSGDGRIPITTARRWGTRGVGVEIHPLRIREANLAAHRAGVADRVAFIEADLFEIDLSGATVITLYLLPELNLRLRPKLLRLAPGTRIVTHNYHMGDWVPERQKIIGDSVVYYWTVPERIPPHLR